MHDVTAPGAFRIAGGDGPLRVDRRQGVRGKGDDHAPQEAPQRRTERNREGGEQERQQDPPGRKSAPSPTSSPGESIRTPCRKPLEAFEQTITAVLALYAFKTAP